MLMKIPFRVILRNKSQFFGIIFLTFLAAMAYILFSLLVVQINTNYRNFVKRANQEDFHLITTKPIDVGEVEKQYGIQMEERFSWDYEFGNKTLRFFHVSSEVNKPEVTEGELPGTGEVAIDTNYAQANKLEVGDSIKIRGEEYKISGIVYLPDYVYNIKNEQDILPDANRFGIGVMRLNDLKKFQPVTPFHYYMAKGKLKDVEAFKEDINSRNSILTYQSRDDNIRIITTEVKMKNAEPMSYVLSGVILVISTILLFIVLKRLIASMHTEIGALYALGYDKYHITRAYLLFPLIIWLVGSVPGAVAGYILAQPFISFYGTFFSIPLKEKILPLQGVFVGVFVPAVFMFAACYLALRGLLKRSVVEVIRGEAEKQFGKKFRMAFLDRFSFKTRLMFKQGFLHPSRELVLILGVVFSTFLLFYAVTAYSGFSGLIDKTYKETFRYNYMYLLQGYQTTNEDYGGEPFNMMTFEHGKEKTKVSIFGLQKNSEMLVLENARGERIKPKGLVVARSLADKLDLKVGDELDVKSVTTGKEYSVKVEEIADLYVGNSGYIDIERFNEKIGLPKGAYIGIFSKKSLSIPKNKILLKITKQDLIKAFEDSSETINTMFQVMGAISFFLSLTIIYVLSSLTIAENRKPLALFKILGYRARELSTIFLGFNNVSFLVGFLLGIPVYNRFVRYVFKELLKNYDFSLKMDVGLKEGLIVFLFLAVAFVISKYLGRRRIYTISPASILKEQME